MSEKEFINNLSSVLADIRKLDTKKIFLNNKDILLYIEESTPTIKHSQDTRETVYENDLWGQYIETKDDGTIVIHDDYLTNPNDLTAWLSNVKAVQDNKAYSEITTNGNGEFTGVVEDSIVANIQTERLKHGGRMFSSTPITSFSGDLNSLVDGSRMFYSTNLTSFNSDLSSLTNGSRMFYSTNLTSFNSDLSSLTDGSHMFESCSNFTSFNGDLSNITNGLLMFCETTLTSFSGDLSNLINGDNMFRSTSLTSFSGDLSNLINGKNMFWSCTSLTSFSGDLSNLTNGKNMFVGTSLIPQSVMYIVESIRNITNEKAKYISGEIPWVTYDSTTYEYSAPFGFMENGDYVYTYNWPDPYTTTISASDVGKLTLGIDVTNNPDTIAQLLQTFAEGCLYESWDKLVQALENKGWTVTFLYRRTNTTITLPEDE